MTTTINEIPYVPLLIGPPETDDIGVKTWSVKLINELNYRLINAMEVNRQNNMVGLPAIYWSLDCTTSPSTGDWEHDGNFDINEDLNVDGDVVIDGTLSVPSTSITTLLVDHIGERTLAHGIVFDNNPTFAGRTIPDLGIVTTVDLNGGTIDGVTMATSNITVGATKTLDVSAGTLTLAAGQIKADKLQNAAADLGAANISIVLSNTNGSYVTNLTTDGMITAATLTDGTVGMTGGVFSAFPLTPSSAPINNYDVANKKYVDDAIVGENLWDRNTDAPYNALVPTTSGDVIGSNASDLILKAQGDGNDVILWSALGLGGTSGRVEVRSGGVAPIIYWSQNDFGGWFGEAFMGTGGRIHYYNSDTQTLNGFKYSFNRSRGSIEAPTNVSSGDILGEIDFNGYKSGVYNNYIKMYASFGNNLNFYSPTNFQEYHQADASYSQYIEQFTTSTGAPVLTWTKGRGTLAAPSGTLSGDQIGNFRFCGVSSSSIPGNVVRRSVGYMQVVADEDCTATASGGHMNFQTSPIGDITPVTRLRLGNDGTVSLYGNTVIGSGTAATDYTLTFDGETNDGLITWMEDENYFEFADDVMLDGKLGVGIAPTYTFDLLKTSSVSGDDRAANLAYNLTNSGTITGFKIAYNSVITCNNTGYANVDATGANFTGNKIGSGNVNSLYGQLMRVDNVSGTGVIGNAVGSGCEIYNSTSQSEITNATGAFYRVNNMHDSFINYAWGFKATVSNYPDFLGTGNGYISTAVGAEYTISNTATLGTGYITNAILVKCSALPVFTDNNQSRYGLWFPAMPDPGAFTGCYSSAIRLQDMSGLSYGGISFGNTGDTTLYRSAANTLKTDDSLVVAGTLETDGGRKITTTTQTTTYAVLSTDELVVGNSTTAFSINLPAATGSGRKLYFKNINTGTVTVDGDSSDTIDGVTTQTLGRWDAMQIVDYAANAWVVV